MMTNKDMLPISMRRKKKGQTAKRIASVAGCFLAGSAVATQTFAYLSGMDGGFAPHFPLSIFRWFYDFYGYPEAGRLFNMSMATGMSTTALTMLPLLASLKDRKEGSTLHGSARWANKKDIREAGFFGTDGVYIGGWEDRKGKLHYLRHNGSEHVLMVAPTRSGKGICGVIPTAVTYKNSCVLTDLKGELWALTAGWRKHFAGQIVLRFEPANSQGSARWNPMDAVRIGTDYEIGDAQNLATMIVDPDGKGLEDHWQKTSQALLVGCILYKLYLRRDAEEDYAKKAEKETEDEKKRIRAAVDASLPGVDAMLADPNVSPKELWEKMIAYRYRRTICVPLIQTPGKALLEDKKKRDDLKKIVHILQDDYREENPNEELIEGYKGDITSLNLRPIAEKYLPKNPEHWDMLTAFVMLMLYERQREKLTPLSFESLLQLLHPKGIMKSEEETDAQADEKAEQLLWKKMAEFTVTLKEAHPTISKSGKDMLDRPEQEAGSVLSTAKSYLALYRDPVVAENVRTSDFRIDDLMNCKRPVSLYLVTQPIDKERLRPLIRILISMICRVLAAKMTFEPTEGGGRRGKSTNKHKMLMLLDEFASLGKLKIIEESIAFLAGYGISLYIIVQDIAQLTSAYGKDESISSNCHILSAFQPLKVDTAEYLSKRTGTTTVVNKKASWSRKGIITFDSNVTDSIDEVQRPLATADEIMNMPGPIKQGERVIRGGDMLVFRAGMPAIYGKQMPYFLEEAFNARVSVDPPEFSDVITDEDRL